MADDKTPAASPAAADDDGKNGQDPPTLPTEPSKKPPTEPPAPPAAAGDDDDDGDGGYVKKRIKKLQGQVADYKSEAIKVAELEKEIAEIKQEALRNKFAVENAVPKEFVQFLAGDEKQMKTQFDQLVEASESYLEQAGKIKKQKQTDEKIDVVEILKNAK